MRSGTEESVRQLQCSKDAAIIFWKVHPNCTSRLLGVQTGGILTLGLSN